MIARQPWIYSARLDGFFILAPAVLVTLLIILLEQSGMAVDTVPPWAWVLLIIGVDVAHVYSTLYRTYFDPEEFRARQRLYVLTPIIGWLVFVAIYSIDGMLFWRVLAYLAVFHFMRQQYGLMMIYGRRERQSRWHKHLDQAAIYLATLYPLVYWHTHPRSFSWFMEGDFAATELPWLHPLVLAIYIAVLAGYGIKEWQLHRSGVPFNWPRNLLLAGTAFAWTVGIVVFDSDLAFTATNVIAHGIPYMALIWIYGRNQSAVQADGRRLHRFFTIGWLPIFVGLLALLAYIEEGLWDGLVWNEHRTLFAPFGLFGQIEAEDTLALLVPLLALPQITHYLLDAAIWRMRGGDTPWKRILFQRSEQTA